MQLININNPDLIMFVGEALVGNDAVDQLRKFNRSLADFSTSKIPRLIDGILLTKFDTVDEKVIALLGHYLHIDWLSCVHGLHTTRPTYYIHRHRTTLY